MLSLSLFLSLHFSLSLSLSLSEAYGHALRRKIPGSDKKFSNPRSIWGLSGVSPGSIRGLSESIKQHSNRKPATGLADPDEAGEKERKNREQESLS